jgi:hypothetical protein
MSAAVMDAGDGTFTLATTGPSASVAVERGLNQATQYCADRSALISVQGTRIEPGGYRIAFQCLEGAPGLVLAAASAPPPGLDVIPAIAPPAPAESLFAPTRPLIAAPSTSGLPGATSPLQPIAGPPAARPTAPRSFGGGTQPASSFWQSGR